ncbi:MAG: hypothetical protein KKF41_09335 [Actinobacteria bacterium]|nr:hypothetical protein [Actinomycetota bacterium]MBU1942984.1 hypothetical protein [Actinomycetota bacterium]MBU2687775.1 hypothetical protein [Actinomycetota bacterium]
MRCQECGTENLPDSLYCKECRAQLAAQAPHPAPVELPEAQPTRLARFLSVTWSRKGPILMALFVGLMMVIVFVPWAFVRIGALGIYVTRTYRGWDIIVPRVMFFLCFIPLVLSLLMVAGIGTRRRIVETHIATFFGGVMFTVWIMIFALSEVFKSLINSTKIVNLLLFVDISGGQIAMIIMFIGFMFGIIVTGYDRGRQLKAMGEGG